MHILYIDDDLVDRMAFQRMIKKNPALSCECFASVGAGISALHSNEYQLIVTDHHLPDGTAYNVLKETNLPVFVTSGVGDDNSVAAFQEAGAQSFMIKPISINDLQKAILLLEQSPHSPAGEVFDLTYLKELSDGDASFEAEMISIYLEEVPDSLKKLKHEIMQKHWLLAAETVHKLRSKIRIMGLHTCLEISESIELAFKKQEVNPKMLQNALALIQALESSLAPASLLKTQLLTSKN